MWHYIIIGLVILIIVSFQIYRFYLMNKERKHFNDIFPSQVEIDYRILKNKDVVQLGLKQLIDLESQKQDLNVRLSRISKESDSIRRKMYPIPGMTTPFNDKNFEKLNLLQTEEKNIKEKIDEITYKINKIKTGIADNPIRNEIFNSINRYLEKNKDTVIDFNIIRDIIDRNCDSVEESIQTQIPIPLYLGLVGTMFGILFGVMFLTFSGSLDNLLSTFQVAEGIVEGSKEWIEAKQQYDSLSIKGISDLFGGVAVAMISSILGIFLTIRGTVLNKDTKVKVVTKKHNFMNWLQSELLPKVSNDFSSALIKLGNDLNGFNKSFASNAQALEKTICHINTSTDKQSDLLDKIQKLDIERISEANIIVYEKLKDCTDDMSSLAEDLQSIQLSVQSLGTFMKNSIGEYVTKHTYLDDASSKVDLAIKDGLEKLTDSVQKLYQQYDDFISNRYNELENETKKVSKKYEEEVDKLHNTIVEKLTDFKQLEMELKNLVSVKTSLEKLEKATTEQNHKLDVLSNSIRELAKANTSTVSTGIVPNYSMTPLRFRFHIGYKIVFFVSCGVLTLTGLFFVVLKILEMLNIL